MVGQGDNGGMKKWRFLIPMLVCLAGPIVGCGGGGSDSDDLNPLDDLADPNDPLSNKDGCLFKYDCDGDGLVNECDKDALDVTVTDLNAICDRDVDGFLDTINNKLATCQIFDQNRDGVIDYKTSDLDLSYELANKRFCDNCPLVANAGQGDADGDLIGDACDTQNCTDTDADGQCDEQDNCIYKYNPSQKDQDGDGQGNECDSDADADGFLNNQDTCPLYADPLQADLDGDFIGDECDPDRDGDGITDNSIPNGTPIPGGTDSCPTVAPNASNNPAGHPTGLYPLYWNGCGFDADKDGIYDHEEAPDCLFIPNSEAVDFCPPMAATDGDMDGVADLNDNCPQVANSDQANGDYDADGNACDVDDDNDGLFDSRDLCPNDNDKWLLAFNSNNSADPNRVRYQDEQLVFSAAYFSGDYPPSAFVLESGTTNINMGKAANASLTYDIKQHLVTVSEELNAGLSLNDFIVVGIYQLDSDNDGVGDGCE